MKTKIIMIKWMMIRMMIRVHKRNRHLLYRKMKMEVPILGPLKIPMFHLSFQIHHKVLKLPSTKMSSKDMIQQT